MAGDGDGKAGGRAPRRRPRRVPSLVVRARAGDLSAWSQLLPPGWLNSYRTDSQAGRTTPEGAAHRAAARPRRVPVKIVAAAVAVVAAVLLMLNSALATDPDPEPARLPVNVPAVPEPAATTAEPPPALPSPRPVVTSPPAGRAAAAPPRRGRVVYPVAPTPLWGYAWMERATAARGLETRLDPRWQWSTGRLQPATADERATVVRHRTGGYTVRLPGAGYPAGIAHTTSFATTSRYYYAPPVEGHSCAVAGYRPSGVDELVDVQCHGPDGTPVDVQFDVFFAAPNAGSAPYATVRYDPPGGAGTHSPIRNSGTSNSAGGANHVHHLGIGRWRAVLSGTALAADGGYVHVTAYGTGTPARCQPESTAATAGGTGREVVVACYAITTGLARRVNTPWLLSYVRGAGLHRAGVPAAYATTTGHPADPVIDRRRSWASNGETPDVDRHGVGAYRLAYDAIGEPNDAPVVTAVGGTPRHCRLFWWDSYSAPPRLTIDVRCYDTAGRPADAQFAVAYLRGP
ncbi:MAG TPA: hypothetical protein VFR67_09450 [Pilimelia sp.]|nr:hypothetical protein [Pilimelia sp.]